MKKTIINTSFYGKLNLCSTDTNWYNIKFIFDFNYTVMGKYVLTEKKQVQAILSKIY